MPIRDITNLKTFLAGSKPFNSKGNEFSTVQAAIDDLAGAGWVFVPAGTWSEVLVIDENNVTLFGTGSASHVTSSDHTLTVSGDDNSIRSLSIFTDGSGKGAVVISGDRVHVWRTDVKSNLGNGIEVTNTASNTIISGVHIRSTTNYGVVNDGLHTRIVNCFLSDLTVNGIKCDDEGDSAVIVGNTIDTSGDDGILIHADAENCIVTGNRITNWTNEAIDDDSGTSTIGDNDLT